MIVEIGPRILDGREGWHAGGAQRLDIRTRLFNQTSHTGSLTLQDHRQRLRQGQQLRLALGIKTQRVTCAEIGTWSEAVTTLSKLIAGIGWVIVHEDDYNIGVLNLSFGADASLPYIANPLSGAVEAAWASGITVESASMPAAIFATRSIALSPSPAAAR